MIPFFPDKMTMTFIVDIPKVQAKIKKLKASRFNYALISVKLNSESDAIQVYSDLQPPLERVSTTFFFSNLIQPASIPAFCNPTFFYTETELVIFDAVTNPREIYSLNIFSGAFRTFHIPSQLLQSFKIVVCNKSLVVFGGFMKKYPNPSTWIINVLFGIQWTSIASDSFFDRSGFTVNVLERNSRIYIFGGISTKGIVFMDLSFLDLANPSSCWIPMNSIGPQARYNHSSAIHESKLYIFGGQDKTNHFSDLWCFDFEIRKWTHLGNFDLHSPRLTTQIFIRNQHLLIIGLYSDLTFVSVKIGSNDAVEFTPAGYVLPNLTGYSFIPLTDGNFVCFGGDVGAGKPINFSSFVTPPDEFKLDSGIFGFKI